MNIVLYSKSGCVNCDRAKQLLKSKGLPFTETDVGKDEEALRLLVAACPEARQMPQIWIDGQRVGGLAGLQAAIKQLGI